jgi:putative ABC transport system permease protein
MLGEDIFQIALRQTYRNKRRYKNVLIGLALGIGGLVTVLTMGGSVERDLGDNLEMLGSATVIKAMWDFDSSRRWHQGEYREKDVKDLESLPGVLMVAPTVWKLKVPVWTLNNRYVVNLGGVGESFFKAIHVTVSHGRKITPSDNFARKSVAVIGKSVARNLFGGYSNVVGGSIFIDGHSFKVIGIIGGVNAKEFESTIFIPLNVARARIPDMLKVRDIYIRAANWDAVPHVQRSALQVLSRNQPGYSAAMHVRHYPERIRTIQNTVLLVKLFIWASIGVTILLGGLGVTSVMMAAVRERTQEIGLRKAVGATDSMIMAQFLVESVIISLTGALSGLFMGLVAVAALKRYLHIQPQYDFFIISLFTTVALGVILGVITGLSPARKASKLTTVDAMRFE